MKIVAVILLSLAVSACTLKPHPDIDPQTSSRLDEILNRKVAPARDKPVGERIALISQAFLGTPYQADTLKGSDSIPEQLVVNFNGVDCFTLLDYVAALSHASSREDFFTQLRYTRYQLGKVRFDHRRHFFSDWFAARPYNAHDITDKLNTPYLTVIKSLNLKAEGERYIPGLPITERVIHYIPANNINAATLKALKTGDYVGIYSPLEGLDVSHTGIVIKTGDQVWLRNASSLKANKKVVDTLLTSYIATRPGIIVARPVEAAAP